MKYYAQHKNCTSVKLECENIVKICREHDSLDYISFMEDEFSKETSLPWVYYAKSNDTIVGFLSVYSYGNAAELCSFVLPQYRNQKIFSKLLGQFQKDYRNFCAYVPVKPKHSAGIHILSHFGFLYTSTEYQMVLLKSDVSSSPNISLSQDFSVKREPEKSDDSFSFFHFYKSHTLIGHGSASFLNNTACLHDIEIFAPYRNKGYGFQCLKLLLHTLFLQYNKIILHVTKENPAACRLYQKLNFQICDEVIYYSKDIVQ